MALSYYSSNWGDTLCDNEYHHTTAAIPAAAAAADDLNSQLLLQPPPPQLLTCLDYTNLTHEQLMFYFSSNNDFALSSSSLAPNFFYDNLYDLHQHPTEDNLNNLFLSHQIPQNIHDSDQIFNMIPNPLRIMNPPEDDQFSLITSSSSSSLHELYPLTYIPNTFPEFPAPPPAPPLFGAENSGKSGGAVVAANPRCCGDNRLCNESLSAQSIAARQRRRKITEKTQELAKLIPGAHKFNTAEMFHAAYKYIKFLQAQVGIFEFMGSNYSEENAETLMASLVESPLIQEKLYSMEKCLAPQKLVKKEIATTTIGCQLHSNSQMLTKLEHFNSM